LRVINKAIVVHGLTPRSDAEFHGGNIKMDGKSFPHEAAHDVVLLVKRITSSRPPAADAFASKRPYENHMPAIQKPPEKMMFQLSLRRRGISDQGVLRAMEEIPRDIFVASADRADAYRDSALGIACGQTISQPFVVAYMTEQLQLQKHHRVLEIGTGSGYQAAILSRLGTQVLTIERYRTLAESARERLEQLGCDNVEVMLGDGFDIPAGVGNFDRIMVTAAMEQIPEDLMQRLEPDGILIAPVGPHQGTQTLVRIVRTEVGFERKELVDVRFVPALPGIAREL
jgi:protein-L-isoaspartate(D-aspartate) O-methyltransferase